jgi:GNAT superfamily N-acetyltransferase
MTDDSNVIISAERPDTPDAARLIGELEAGLTALYPAESCHGLSVEQLIRAEVAFFVLRCGGQPAGCGGVQLFGSAYGEVKRVYVRPALRGRGLSKRIMEHLEAYARERGVPLMRLETGVHQHEAIGLYERLGYRRIGPFGEYKPAPLSLFYEKRIR